MDFSVEAPAFKDLIAKTNTQEIVIFLTESASRDQMAAALALYLSLAALGKTVKVAYPKSPTLAWSHLIGINKVVTAIGNKNFIISLDYAEGSIEKVSYNIEGNKFNLVIEPKAGSSQSFDEKNVRYSYGGLSAGLFITIGVSSLEMLGKYYTDNKDIFGEKDIVAIDHNVGHKPYGKLQIVRPASSSCEIVTHLLRTCDLPVNSDIATNLYDGVIVGSRNFSVPQVLAGTFEAAAYLLHKGARKQAPVIRSEELPRQEFSAPRTEEKQLPPDWFKPKIFKGSSLI